MGFNLGFDLDGVIGQTAEMAIKHVNDVFKCKFTVDVLNTFNFYDNVFSDDPDEQKVVVDVLVEAVFNKELLSTIKSYPGASKALHTLKHKNHKIFIITKRSVDYEEMTADWLHKYNIPYDGLVLTGNKDKSVFARKFRLDFFIDDLEDNLYELYKHKTRWEKGLFLMNRPWNINKYIDTTKITRVKDWNRVVQVINVGNRLKF